jgi:hypothetical protein
LASSSAAMRDESERGTTARTKIVEILYRYVVHMTIKARI